MKTPNEKLSELHSAQSKKCAQCPFYDTCLSKHEVGELAQQEHFFATNFLCEVEEFAGTGRLLDAQLRKLETGRLRYTSCRYLGKMLRDLRLTYESYKAFDWINVDRELQVEISSRLYDVLQQHFLLEMWEYLLEQNKEN